MSGKAGVPLGFALNSDGTALTVQTNGAKAWPLYITLMNVEQKVRQTKSARCLVCIGFLQAVDAPDHVKVISVLLILYIENQRI